MRNPETRAIAFLSAGVGWASGVEHVLAGESMRELGRPKISMQDLWHS